MITQSIAQNAHAVQANWLNLGCGRKHVSGAINVDRVAAVEPDTVVGLASALRLGRIWKYAILACALLMPGAKFARLLTTHLGPATAASRAGRQDVSTNVSAISQSLLSLTAWFDSRRDPAMDGLWATSALCAEWLKAQALAQGKRAAVLETDGCTPLFYPAVFMPPVSLYLIPGLTLPSEIARTLDQINRADVLVFPVGLGMLRQFPQLGAQVNADFQPVLRAAYVLVFARKPVQAPAMKSHS